MTTHAFNAVDSSTASLIDQVADARAQRMPLRIVGGGTWRDAGRAVAATRVLSVAPHAGVIEYVPTDLVITVRSGTTLADIEAVTAEHGQWLAIDPAGSAHGTIGATVATASSGPLSLGSGTVRDLVLGLGVVTGLGTRIRVGGRVVKNVAGFDLVRLNTGAWGTLGVITDVSLRLHAKPAVDASFALTHADVTQLLDVVRSLKHDALTLHALEILNPEAARAVDISSAGAWVLLARATGNAAAVAAQRALLAAFGRVDDIDSDVWMRMRTMDEFQEDSMGDSSYSLRVSGRISSVADTVALVNRACTDAGLDSVCIRVTPHRGLVRLLIPREPKHDGADDQARVISRPVAHTERVLTAVSQLRRDAHQIIGERLPTEAWRALPSPTQNTISLRIRDAFDPDRIMNPGIFGEHDT